MANVSVYNIEGKEVGTIDLNDAVFGVEVNEHLVHMAVVSQLANKRQGTQKAKTRSEVSGGGRKPWRQKGTGHARQGSTRAPQWTGGGVVFAPTPRDYSFKLNKKERRAALKSALTSRVEEKKVSSGEQTGFGSMPNLGSKTKTVRELLATGGYPLEGVNEEQFFTQEEIQEGLTLLNQKIVEIKSKTPTIPNTQAPSGFGVFAPEPSKELKMELPF